ncbi:hypothetical protein GOBAR_AA35110 [Gossypium barbadense]|uniref:Uncharacterized protein n=1 Tax=Gossypium barbadense TaxID=3634 RepID=A0A2P5W3B6_GOSBA|nr:hypothetical protein GOBAR_AA35110 [Gossypium barbadense]
MEFVDDEDLETMITLYCSTGNMKVELVELFIELANVEPGKDFNDPNIDEVLDDIDDEGMDDDDNVYTLLLGNPTHAIAMRNDPEARMLSIDPNMAHASKFLKYSDIIYSHMLVAIFESEELFIIQQFANNEECIFAIKRYNMKM